METVLDKALRVERERMGGDNLESALTYSLIGLLDVYREKFDVAIENILLGRKIREQMLGAEHRLIAASDYLLAAAFAHKGEYSKALEFFDNAVRIYTILKDEDHYNLSISILGIGYVYFLRSEFDIALSYFHRAYDLVSDGDGKYATVSADCERFLGWTYAEKGENDLASSHLTAAIAKYSSIFGDHAVLLTSCYSRLGMIYEAEGNYDRAIELYNRAISLDKRYVSNDNSFIALELRRLGSAYANKKDFNNALSFSKQALRLHRKSRGENHPDIAYTYEILGNTYQKRGEYSLALKQYQKALALRRQLSESADRNDIPNLYAEIGSVFDKLKSYDRAIEYFSKALTLHDNLLEQNRRQRAATLKGFGDTYNHMKKYQLSLHYYQKSLIALCPGFNDSSAYANPTDADLTIGKDLIEVLAAKANAFANYRSLQSSHLSCLRASLETYECASRILDRLRKKYTSEGSKLFLEAEYHYLYQQAATLSLKLIKLTGDRRFQESAFYFAENSKANVLVDGIHEAEAKHFANIPDSVIEDDRRMHIDLRSCETQLQRELEKKDRPDDSRVVALRDECFGLNSRIEQSLTSIEREYPRYFALKYKTHSPTISEVQNSLDERTCLVEYFLGDREIIVFLITHDNVNIRSFRIPANFDGLAHEFHSSIKTIRGELYVRDAARLFDILVKPMQALLSGKKRLLIVPDGVLYYVPFEALLQSAPSKTDMPCNFTKLNYLLNSFEFSYAYSSAFYLNRLIKTDSVKTKTASFVGFAPVFRDTMLPAPLLRKNTATDAKDSAMLGSQIVNGKRFSTLRYSEEEVTLIARAFESSGGNGRTYLRSGASEDNFKMHSSEFSFVHVATHGYINEEHPQLSMLLFAQPSGEHAAEDGVLFASETFDLSLNADLVVLSCCESGLGKYVNGEGMMAMTRGFFYSGARNVLFSLWKVYDRQTSELMLRFYQNILSDESFPSALRNAKLSMIKNESTAFPSKWSGFILVGD